MGNFKQINIKNRTYYFFNDMINIKNFDSGKKSCKNIDIYYIGYITIKDTDYVNIHNANPLYFIIDKADGRIEESNGNKYLTLVSNDKNKEILKKYTELWNKIKDLTKPGNYDDKYMKIKFSSDDNFPLGKILSLHNMTIVVRSVFQEDNKYYPQVFLDECLCELQMLKYDRTDTSERIDINKTNASKEWDICHYWYFLGVFIF